MRHDARVQTSAINSGLRDERREPRLLLPGAATHPSRESPARADVAQLVEHFTRNEGVPGSIPGVGSGNSLQIERFRNLARSRHGEYVPRRAYTRTMRRASLTTAEQRRRGAERTAAPSTPDDRTMLVGMSRSATAEELRAFVAREQARVRAERELPAA
jgi:hypothetical protein